MMGITDRQSRRRAIRAGWDRHDWMVSALALALSPACMARRTQRPAGNTPAGSWRRVGDAYDTARSSIAMAFQLPG